MARGESAGLKLVLFENRKVGLKTQIKLAFDTCLKAPAPTL